MTITRRRLLLSASALAGTSMLPFRAKAGKAIAPQDSVEVLSAPTHLTDAAAEAVSLSDFESLARYQVSHMAFEFIAGGAGDENTVRWNREALDKIRIHPRVLVDVSQIDTSVTIFGMKLPFPILLAPTGYHRLIHPEGEIATARGASDANITYVISSASTTPIEEIAASATRPLWFQMYVQPDRGFTRELVQRVEGAGCKALCVTVDTPVTGARNRQQRAHFKVPPEIKTPHLCSENACQAEALGARAEMLGVMMRTQRGLITWKEIEWLSSFVRVPILLKGLLHPDDAERAIQAGVSGVIVSNHGGRNLDTVPATIEALPLIVDRVAGRVPLLMDGGIRRGTDILKALALGAKAVLIGRPYCYGLGVAGSDGVARVVEILRTEFEMAMTLSGCPSIESIKPSILG